VVPTPGNTSATLSVPLIKLLERVSGASDQRRIFEHRWPINGLYEFPFHGITCPDSLPPRLECRGKLRYKRVRKVSPGKSRLRHAFEFSCLRTPFFLPKTLDNRGADVNSNPRPGKRTEHLGDQNSPGPAIGERAKAFDRTPNRFLFQQPPGVDSNAPAKQRCPNCPGWAGPLLRLGDHSVRPKAPPHHRRNKLHKCVLASAKNEPQLSALARENQLVKSGAVEVATRRFISTHLVCTTPPPSNPSELNASDRLFGTAERESF